jgi:hypothetical protein
VPTLAAEETAAGVADAGVYVASIGLKFKY